MKNITLTKQQEKGLKIAVDRYQKKERYTTISGHPGTGKTFLINAIVDKLNLNEDNVVFVSYVGKASLRLREMGNKSAKTIHNFLYKTQPLGGGNFIHTIKPRSDFQGIRMIVVDEVSMVPDKLIRDLASLGIHILFLGDSFQLPPIAGRDNGLLKKPHITLTEVMRREKENTITVFSEKLREGKYLDVVSDDFIRVYEKEDLTIEMLSWADQVICGKNKTRKGINDSLREAKGFYSHLPMEGEKIIMNKNMWETYGSKGTPVINGMIGIMEEDLTEPKDLKFVSNIGGECFSSKATFRPDFDKSETFKNILIDSTPFVYEDVSGKPRYGRKVPQKIEMKLSRLDFGYAITTHKAQGSEYEKVLGVEEVLGFGRGPEDRLMHRRWLYTLITRSSGKVVIVRDKNSGLWRI